MLSQSLSLSRWKRLVIPIKRNANSIWEAIKLNDILGESELGNYCMRVNLPRGGKIMEEKWMMISMENPLHPELLWKEGPHELTSRQALGFSSLGRARFIRLNVFNLIFHTLERTKATGRQLSPSGRPLCIFRLPLLHCSSMTFI